MRPVAVLIAVSLCLLAYCPSSASDQQERFLEIPGEADTLTYDLDTVQFISPGRFTIMSTQIDNPDAMKLELKTLSTLRNYCARPDGKYPAPPDLLQLGPPDLTVEQIKVQSGESPIGAYSFKVVSWEYPYVRFHGQLGSLHCKLAGRTETDLFWEVYNLITNGFRSKGLYDCKRGLIGIVHDDDDTTRAFTVQKGTVGFARYRVVCRAVTHEEPYLPE